MAHKIALMENSIHDLASGQKALLSLVEDNLSQLFSKSSSTSGHAPSVIVPAPGGDTHAVPTTFAEMASKAISAAGSTASRGVGQPRAKRINSVVADEILEQSDDEVWEVTAEEKRRSKLQRRNEEKKLEDLLKKKNEDKKKPKFIVGTGSNLESKQGDCPGQAAPKHVFVARTAMSTTKETVEGCLEYLAGIKGVATCCTPQERIDSGEAYSLSWRVQIDSDDYDKALLPSSWKSG